MGRKKNRPAEGGHQFLEAFQRTAEGFRRLSKGIQRFWKSTQRSSESFQEGAKSVKQLLEGFQRSGKAVRRFRKAVHQFAEMNRESAETARRFAHGFREATDNTHRIAESASESPGALRKGRRRGFITRETLRLGWPGIQGRRPKSARPRQSRRRLAAPALTPGPSPKTGEGRTAKSTSLCSPLPLGEGPGVRADVAEDFDEALPKSVGRCLVE